jgi:CheY-like chemotaxis protein/AraC-like DNA-binding protein
MQRKSKKANEGYEQEIEALRQEVAIKKEEAENTLIKRREDWLVSKRVTLLFLKNLLQRVDEVLPAVVEMNDRPTLPANFPNVQNLYRNTVIIKSTGEQLEEIYRSQMDDAEGKVEIAPYSIQKILYEVNQKLLEIIDTNQIVYRFNKFARPELKVYVNKEQLSFTLKNLLLNAFNHIQHRGMVTLTVSEEISDDDNTCMIDISYSSKLPIKHVDDLAKEDCPIFDLNSIELGWDYINAIVKKIGGKVNYKNEEGATNITLTIPTIVEKVQNLDEVKLITIPEDKDIEETTTETQDATKHSGNAKSPNAVESRKNSDVGQGSEIFENSDIQQKKKNTILIISNRQEIVTYMKVLLNPTYNIKTAGTGAEGVEKAKNEKPDMIMCDVEVQGTGFQVCQEIRSDLTTCHLPFILVTTKVEDDDLVRGLEIGADDYMLKPFTPGLIKAKIENLIKNRRVMRQKYSNLMVQLNSHNETDGTDSNDKDKSQSSFINEVVKIIEDNILEPDFSVKSLAASLNMSQPTLYRKIKQKTNCTIIELIISIKIRRAAIFLKEGNYSVQEVAEKVGYNDVSTFRKNFVEIMGTTPSTYNGQQS